MFRTLVEDVITTIHEDRGYKVCQCFLCKWISKCTPENDFYSTDEHGDKIICESCFKKHLKSTHRIERFIGFGEDTESKLRLEIDNFEKFMEKRKLQDI